MHKPDQTDQPVQAIFNVERLGMAPMVFPIRTDAAVCRQLADFLFVDAVENFYAELTLKRWRGRGVRVEGTVRATIVQSCVVTLEPVRSEVSEAVTARFLPESMLERDMENAAEIIIDPLAEDPPEAFDGREIDLGALAVEFLALGIDAYPRAPGVSLETPSTEAEAAVAPVPARKNPFQVLEKLKPKQDG